MDLSCYLQNDLTIGGPDRFGPHVGKLEMSGLPEQVYGRLGYSIPALQSSYSRNCRTSALNAMGKAPTLSSRLRCVRGLRLRGEA